MKIIAENIHIISKTTKEAILNRDKFFIKNIVEKINEKKPDFIDLNVGPARGKFSGSIEWLSNICQEINSDLDISFDSTNIEEIESGLKIIKRKENSLINSTNADIERLEKYTDLACKYKTNIVGLTLNKEIGIPKESGQRLELALSIYEKCSEKGIENNKIYFDPLILPIMVEQSQAKEALDTIRMLKESFDPPVNITIGLSNISNGAPLNLRPLINRVFLILALGCGLNSAIIDIFDDELLRLIKVIETEKIEKEKDKLYIKIYNMMKNYEEIDDIQYDKNNKEESDIIKTVKILLNKNIYSHSYTSQ